MGRCGASWEIVRPAEGEAEDDRLRLLFVASGWLKRGGDFPPWLISSIFIEYTMLYQ